METIIEISETFLLDILKQQKFKFTLKEIDSIISPELKEDLLDKIGLDSEKLESSQMVKNWMLYII